MTHAELRSHLEHASERTETIRSLLDIAEVPLDEMTRRALSDLSVEIERMTQDRRKETEGA